MVILLRFANFFEGSTSSTTTKGRPFGGFCMLLCLLKASTQQSFHHRCIAQEVPNVSLKIVDLPADQKSLMELLPTEAWQQNHQDVLQYVMINSVGLVSDRS